MEKSHMFILFIVLFLVVGFVIGFAVNYLVTGNLAGEAKFKGIETIKEKVKNCIDTDADGYGTGAGTGCTKGGNDCNDNDATINPGKEEKYAPEICDLKDNNCDGLIDKYIPATGNTCTSCGCPGHSGVIFRNSNGIAIGCNCTQNDKDGDGWDTFYHWVTKDGVQVKAFDCNDNNANINPIAVEVCDGINNDCDDQVDETFINLHQSCSVGIGECTRTGTYVCSTDKKSTVCSATAGSPSVEVCDGKDNDCDGQVDEGLLNACGQCGSVPAETCDGKDNDCDGTNDNGFTTADCKFVCIASNLVWISACASLESSEAYSLLNDANCNSIHRQCCNPSECVNLQGNCVAQDTTQIVNQIVLVCMNTGRWSLQGITAQEQECLQQFDQLKVNTNNFDTLFDWIGISFDTSVVEFRRNSMITEIKENIYDRAAGKCKVSDLNEIVQIFSNPDIGVQDIELEYSNADEYTKKYIISPALQIFFYRLFVKNEWSFINYNADGIGGFIADLYTSTRGVVTNEGIPSGRAPDWILTDNDVYGWWRYLGLIAEIYVANYVNPVCGGELSLDASYYTNPDNPLEVGSDMYTLFVNNENTQELFVGLDVAYRQLAHACGAQFPPTANLNVPSRHEIDISRCDVDTVNEVVTAWGPVLLKQFAAYSNQCAGINVVDCSDTNLPAETQEACITDEMLIGQMGLLNNWAVESMGTSVYGSLSYGTYDLGGMW